MEIESILENYDRYYISIISYLEVMGFQFAAPEEAEILRLLLDDFEQINITPEIAENVISMKQRKKIKLPDAIILATAQALNCDLMTRNVKDFENVVAAVNIINPFDSRSLRVL